MSLTDSSLARNYTEKAGGGRVVLKSKRDRVRKIFLQVVRAHARNFITIMKRVKCRRERGKNKLFS